jgi:hypothetical protein
MVKKNLPSPFGDREHVLGAAPKAVQLPDAQGVALAQVLQRCRETRPVGVLAGRLVLEHLGAPGFRQGISLKLGILGIGAHALVADQWALRRLRHDPDHSETHSETKALPKHRKHEFWNARPTFLAPFH